MNNNIDNLAHMIVSGGVYSAESVEVQPDCVLSSWSIREATDASGVKTRHFVGRNHRDRDGRASTPIVSFDKATMTGKTESGRVYALIGSSGGCSDGDYVWGRYMRANGLVSEEDVSAAFEG